MTKLILYAMVSVLVLSGCATKSNKEVYEFWQKKQLRDCVRNAVDEFDLKICTEIDDVSYLEYEKMKKEAERDRR